MFLYYTFNIVYLANYILNIDNFLKIVIFFDLSILC